MRKYLEVVYGVDAVEEAILVVIVGLRRGEG